MEGNNSSYTLMMITHAHKKRSDLKDLLYYLGGRLWNKEIYYQHVTRESFSSAAGRDGGNGSNEDEKRKPPLCRCCPD